MNGFAIVTLLIAAGVVSGRETVEVKRGDKFVLVENKSGLENFSRIRLYEASEDCNLKREMIFSYCSPKEKESGCINKNCSTFSFDIGKDSVSFTPLNDASDGCYVASYIFNNSNKKKFFLIVNGQLSHTVIPDPPPQENPEANSPKGTETPRTDDLSTLGFTVGNTVAIPGGNTEGNTVGNTEGNTEGIIVGIIVGIVVFIAVVLIAVGILVWCCLKKKKNESKARDCKKDPKNNSLLESNIKGEQGDFFKMRDRIPRSEDEDIHSLNEVLMHDPSVGQDNERPGQHVQHNNSDDYDDNSKHNNSNNDIDSDFCSNYEDDEIKSSL